MNTCSFCGKREAEVGALSGGPPTIFICDECLDLCRDIIAEELDWEKKRGKPASRTRAANEPPLACSFCGKSQDAVDKLIAGPRNYICDACVRRFSAEA